MRSGYLAALIFGAMPAWAEMTHLQTYEWVIDRDYFGGFSGIELTEDGSRFYVISDAGYFARGVIEREDGLITRMRQEPFYLFPDPLRWPVTGDESRDSEGLAVTDDERIFVAYEGITTIREEPGRDATPIRLPDHPDFATLQRNGSLEALAVAPDGTLYAIPERSGRALRAFPVYRLGYGASQWDIAFDVPRLGTFVPVGADIGPDGSLYLLERDFNGWAFSTRIRRFELDGSGGEILLETAPGVHDNLEGIAIWREEEGLRITLISDDNFRWLQRTEIVEYRLTE